jgi:hypothetical protein
MNVASSSHCSSLRLTVALIDRPVQGTVSLTALVIGWRRQG